MSVIIHTGGSTAGNANVDAGFNLKTTLPTDPAYIGLAGMTSRIDAGSVTGAALYMDPEATDDYRLRVGLDTPVYSLNFEGAVVPQAHVQQNATAFTFVQGSGFLQINAANNVTGANGGNIRTYRSFSLLGPFNTYCEMLIRHTNPTATNAISEWGLGQVSGVVAGVADGAFLRLASSGTFTAGISFGGTETAVAVATAAIANRDGTAAPLDLTKTQKFSIAVGFDKVRFWINDILVATIAVPSAQPLAMAACAQPIFARVYNSGAASAARKLDIGFISASGGDANAAKPWPHIVAGYGGGGYQIQPGLASGQTSTYAGGAAPGAGTYTANTAPLTNSLGGLWLSVSPIPAAAESDYPLFAWQNPSGSAALPGKTFYCTGLRIGETFVTVVLGATATILTWAIAVGSTANTLATTDGAATVGPRRKALGAQAFAVTAPAGTIAAGFERQFTVPLVVPPGCYLHIINRFLLNAATGQLRGSVDIDGYFE